MARTALTTIGSLLAPAIAIVFEDGLNGLSFRTLAQSVGASVSSITSLAGTKVQLIAALIEVARQRDSAIYAPLLALARHAGPLSPEGLAEMADVMLETAAQTEPHLQVFLSELLQASATQPDLVPALEPWLADQRGLWRQLAEASVGDHNLLLGEALFAASIDERAHGTALQSIPAYRRLRRLCLGRLCRHDFGGRTRNGDAALFQHMFTQLGEVADGLGIDRGDVAHSEIKQPKLAGVAARVLVYEGASELTHRAVAARANVPSSTLAYHFRTREDLMKGAMQVIIHGLQHAMFAGGAAPDGESRNNPGYDIARSTYALALEASRSPQYVGSAADMRRKRGINLVRVVNAERLPGRQIDPLGAQVIAVVGIGATLATAHRGIEAARQASDAIMARLLEIPDDHIARVTKPD